MTSQPRLRQLSIVIPVLDEAAGIADWLTSLHDLRQDGAEIIIVDGGSSDDTARLAAPHADQVISAPRGRGAQMNAGAAAAGGSIMLFLHADTRLPAAAATLIVRAIDQGAIWGRFDVKIESQANGLGLIAFMMNWRSRLTGIATGDQAIFVTKAAFTATGGFADIPLMEDIEFSRRMRALARPACLSGKVLTSGRRWEKHGVLRTIVTMWRLRLRYFLGANPNQLAREYGYAPRQQ